MEAFSCINYKLWVTITNCCINNNFFSVSDISVTIDPIKREDGQEIKVDRTTKHSRTPPPLCDLLQPPRWFSFLTLGMSRSACLTSFTRWATLTLDFRLTAVFGGYNIERTWQRWWKICFFAVSVGQAVPNRRSKGAQSQLGAGKYGLEWLFHCHYRDRDIFLDLIYVAQQSSLILKLKMFFPTDAQRLPGPGMPILHQDDSRDEYQLHRREERQRRHWPRPPPGSGLKAPMPMPTMPALVSVSDFDQILQPSVKLKARHQSIGNGLSSSANCNDDSYFRYCAISAIGALRWSIQKSKWQHRNHLVGN